MIFNFNCKVQVQTHQQNHVFTECLIWFSLIFCLFPSQQLNKGNKKSPLLPPYGSRWHCMWTESEVIQREQTCPRVLVLPLSGSALGQVKHLSRVQVPHEGLEDLCSLGGITHTHRLGLSPEDGDCCTGTQ